MSRVIIVGLVAPVATGAMTMQELGMSAMEDKLRKEFKKKCGNVVNAYVNNVANAYVKPSYIRYINPSGSNVFTTKLERAEKSWLGSLLNKRSKFLGLLDPETQRPYFGCAEFGGKIECQCTQEHLEDLVLKQKARREARKKVDDALKDLAKGYQKKEEARQRRIEYAQSYPFGSCPDDRPGLDNAASTSTKTSSSSSAPFDGQMKWWDVGSTSTSTSSSGRSSRRSIGEPLDVRASFNPFNAEADHYREPKADYNPVGKKFRGRKGGAARRGGM